MRDWLSACRAETRGLLRCIIIDAARSVASPFNVDAEDDVRHAMAFRLVRGEFELGMEKARLKVRGPTGFWMNV